MFWERWHSYTNFERRQLEGKALILADSYNQMIDSQGLLPPQSARVAFSDLYTHFFPEGVHPNDVKNYLRPKYGQKYPHDYLTDFEQNLGIDINNPRSNTLSLDFHTQNARRLTSFYLSILHHSRNQLLQGLAGYTVVADYLLERAHQMNIHQDRMLASVAQPTGKAGARNPQEYKHELGYIKPYTDKEYLMYQAVRFRRLKAYHPVVIKAWQSEGQKERYGAEIRFLIQSRIDMLNGNPVLSMSSDDKKPKISAITEVNLYPPQPEEVLLRHPFLEAHNHSQS